MLQCACLSSCKIRLQCACLQLQSQLLEFIEKGLSIRKWCSRNHCSGLQMSGRFFFSILFKLLKFSSNLTTELHGLMKGLTWWVMFYEWNQSFSSQMVRLFESDRHISFDRLRFCISKMIVSSINWTPGVWKEISSVPQDEILWIGRAYLFRLIRGGPVFWDACVIWQQIMPILQCWMSLSRLTRGGSVHCTWVSSDNLSLCE